MKSFIQIFLSIVATIIILTILSLYVVYEKSIPSTSEEKINEIVYNVENLPDSYIKKNLMLTIAGEYGGYSEDLFYLLKPFSEMNLKEMNK
jgi:hypothetical protein